MILTLVDGDNHAGGDTGGYSCYQNIYLQEEGEYFDTVEILGLI